MESTLITVGIQSLRKRCKTILPRH